MQGRKLVLFVTLLVMGSVALLAQESKIKKKPAEYTSPAEGKQMYTEYCAACHGTDGKGNGPAAGALKVPPADLTALASKNNGKFPTERVAATLEGKVEVMAHGSKDMPVWGPIFYKMSQGRKAEVQMRVNNLAKYIESLQGK